VISSKRFQSADGGPDANLVERGKLEQDAGGGVKEPQFGVEPHPATALQTELVEAARAYATHAKSENTRRAYASDWRTFEAWCREHQKSALPALPATIALYVAALAGRRRKVSTITRALAAISQAHQLAGHETPTTHAHVREVLKGVRRVVGVAQAQKAPIEVDTLRGLVATLDDSLRGQRDRALLLLGFSGAFRRSELVGLDVGDVAFVHRGLEVTVRRSKTDQESAGRKLGVLPGKHSSTCPVLAVRSWIESASLVDGPLFRRVTMSKRRSKVAETRLSEKVVVDVVKRAAAAAGLDESHFAGHSLRAGFITSAARAGKSERSIMAMSGHRSTDILRRYIRDIGIFDENAGDGLGL